MSPKVLLAIEKKITVYEHLVDLISREARLIREFNTLQEVSFSVKHGET